MALLLFVGFFIWLRCSHETYNARVLRSRNYLTTRITTKIRQSAIAAANPELFQKHYTAIGIIKADFWQIYDVSCVISGDNYARRYYYSVFEAKLQRTVPHLVFDSKISMGRQFQFVYDYAQTLTLEADIDNYFAVYAPETYQIDVLSFVTPEVVETMLQMKDCDFEFVDDYLLCYSSLLSQSAIADFQQRCLALHDSINNNLSSYRDDRLGGQARKDDVSQFAKRLLPSSKKYLPKMLFVGLMTLGSLAIMVVYSFWIAPLDLDEGEPASYRLAILIPGAIVLIIMSVAFWRTIRKANKDKRNQPKPQPK